MMLEFTKVIFPIYTPSNSEFLYYLHSELGIVNHFNFSYSSIVIVSHYGFN